MGQESLTRFDQPKKKKRPNSKRKVGSENAIVAGPKTNSENRRPAITNTKANTADRKPVDNRNKPTDNRIRPAENKIKPINKNEPKK